MTAAPASAGIDPTNDATRWAGSALAAHVSTAAVNGGGCGAGGGA
jgi:hypothetical protein